MANNTISSIKVKPRVGLIVCIPNKYNQYIRLEQQIQTDAGEAAMGGGGSGICAVQIRWQTAHREFAKTRAQGFNLVDYLQWYAAPSQRGVVAAQ